jgi:hypothetical protein
MIMKIPVLPLEPSHEATEGQSTVRVGDSQHLSPYGNASACRVETIFAQQTPDDTPANRAVMPLDEFSSIRIEQSHDISNLIAFEATVESGSFNT